MHSTLVFNAITGFIRLNKPPAIMAGKKARLILRAANTMWAGYVSKEFRGLFGKAYTSWAARQEKRPAMVNENWLLEQSLPLKVFTQKESGQWQYVDHFPMTGNTASRDLIMELDLPSTPFQTIDIKLETVYRFWEIDYAALDNSFQPFHSSEWLNPELAVHSDGKPMGKALVKKDTSYVRLSGTEHLKLRFRLQNQPDSNFTWFLCGTGYYHQSPMNESKAQIGALMRFKKPGAFHAFSVEKYHTLATAFTRPPANIRK